MRKTFHFLIAAIMAIAASTTPARAATSGSCGDNLTFYISGDVLYINGQGAMPDYDYGSASANAAPWRGENFKYVKFSPNVNYIGAYAFTGCEDLVNIDLSDCDYLTYIGTGAFMECTSLESANLSGCTRLSYLGIRSFMNCYSLKSVDLSGCTSLTGVGGQSFRNCSSFTTLDLTGCTALATVGTGTFWDCTSLESVDFSAGSLTRLSDSSFEGCTSLKSIDVSGHLELDSVGGRAFYGCSSLESVDFSNTALRDIGNYVFYGCSSLRTVVLGDSVRSIGNWAFGEVRSLASINLPDSLKEIGNAAFYSCSGLSSFDLPLSLEVIGDSAFYGCISIKTLDLRAENPIIGDYAFYGCSGLTSVFLPRTITNFGSGAFMFCASLEIMAVRATDPPTLGDSYVFSGVSTTGCVFYVPDGSVDTYKDTDIWRLYNIQPMSSRFCGENLMWSIENNTLVITGDGEMWDFDNSDLKAPWLNSSFTAVDFPEEITKIGDYAFYYYTYNDLSSVDFSDCTELDSIGYRAFAYCSRLSSLDLSECTNLKYIGSEAFRSCTGFISISLPSSLTNIDSYAFAGCSSLPLLDLSGCVTLTNIGEYAFYGCSQLTELTLPSMLANIGDYAFSNCTSLATLIVYATSVPGIYGNTFNGVDKETTPVYVPDASVDFYKNDAFWGGFECIYALSTIGLTSVSVASMDLYFTYPDYLVVVDGVAGALRKAMVDEWQSEYEACKDNQTSDAYVTLWNKVQEALVKPEDGTWIITAGSSSDRSGEVLTSVNTVFYYTTGNMTTNSLTTETFDNTVESPMLWQFETVGDDGYQLLNVNTNRYLAGGASTGIINLKDDETDNTYTFTWRSGADLAIGCGNNLYLNAWSGSAGDNVGLSTLNDVNSVWNVKLADTIHVNILDEYGVTMCLPVGVTLPDGVTARTVESATGSYVVLDDYEGTRLPAYTPVIIYGEAGIYSFPLWNGIAIAFDTGFEGFCPSTTIPTSVNMYILAQKSEGVRFYRMTNEGDYGYVNEVTNRTTNPNRAFYVDETTSAYALRISFGDAGTTTGISTATTPTPETNGEKVYYDLNGRRVLYPSRGIYVTADGKKVFIK